MTFRKDILRGVRFGAIGLALVLAGVVVYRVVHVGPAVEATPTPEAVAQVPVTYPEPDPVVPVQVPPPPLPPDATVVPPPSPTRAANRPASRNVARSAAPVYAKPSVERSDLPSTEASYSPPPSAEPVVEAKPAAVEPVAQAPATSEAAAPGTEEQVAPPAGESRGKKLIKAVGRFLHIGPKKQ